jgi:hypothetical protein
MFTKKIVASVLFSVAFLAFVMPVKAEIISQIKDFERRLNSRQESRVVFDLSKHDLSKVDRINLDLSAILKTHLVLASVYYTGGYDVEGVYSGDINYGLGVTVNGQPLQRESRRLTDTVTYNIGKNEKTILKTGESFKSISYAENSLNWLSDVDLRLLLDANSILTIDFGLRGPSGNIVTPEFPDGITNGITTDAISKAVVSIELVQSSPVPEPASMLIFGLAGAAGIPLVNRLRRKNRK